MPLLRAADPASGVIRNDLKSVVCEQLGADRPAAVGRVGRVERCSFAVVELDEAGVLDAVGLGVGDRKDDAFAQVVVGPEDHLDIVAVGSGRPAFDLGDRRKTRGRIDGDASIRADGSRPERQRRYVPFADGTKAQNEPTAILAAHRTGRGVGRCSD